MLMVDHETQLLTVKEVAKLLGLHPVSVYRRCQSGELEHFKLGTGPKARVRIPRDAVIRYIADSYKLKGGTP
jgi:excisionase family DNA binding protein